MTQHIEYDAAGSWVHNRHAIVYDARGLVLAEKASTREGSNWIHSHTANYYSANGTGAAPPEIAAASWRGLASLDWKLPTQRMLRVDASLSYVADRSGSASVSLDVPDYTLLSFGLRYEPIDRLTLRMQVQNVLDSYAYSVSSTSAFNYLSQHAVRLAGSYTF